jgi:hypothetical protein
MDRMADREFLVKLTRSLMDEGKLIEAGWIAMRLACIPLDAPAVQLQDMKMAFMAGAHHLFASVLGGMEDDNEPTATDMRRMELIDAELMAFTEELKAWVARGPSRG